MTRTDLRVHALTLAVQTTGQPNKIEQAETYLAFLSQDVDTIAVAPAPLTVQGKKR